MSSALGLGSAIFALVAAWFLHAGFSIEVTVETEAGTVANLQLMHIQSTNIAIGIGSAIVSAVMAVGAVIAAAIRSAPPE